MSNSHEVYTAIQEERAYQAAHYPSGEGASVEHHVALIARYSNKLLEEFADRPGNRPALHTIRKIAALAFRALEVNGVATRNEIAMTWASTKAREERGF